MDLGAYVQIEELESIAQVNGISIPRLRGYRLMKNEQPKDSAWFTELMRDCELDAIQTLCSSDPTWSLSSYSTLLNRKSDRFRSYYITYGTNKYGKRAPVGIRWERIHGKKRRILKFAIKQNKKAALKQYLLWNKYAGKEDVLYIHSRMGGYNWKHYTEKENITSQPWFLDRVDDWWDGTYCDFYAIIDTSLTLGEDKR